MKGTKQKFYVGQKTQDSVRDNLDQELYLGEAYPMLLMCIMIAITITLENKEHESNLEYPEMGEVPFLDMGYLKKGSNVLFLTGNANGCSDASFIRLQDQFNQSAHVKTIDVHIYCLESEADVQKAMMNTPFDIGFGFTDPSSLSYNSNETVQYSIRLPQKQFSLVNWTPFVSTYHQQPSVVPSLFYPLFLSSQSFMDNLITQVKTNQSTSHTYSYKQYPNESYSEDTRLNTLQYIMPLYIILLTAFPLMSVVRRLLEERESRMQEGLKMAGLSDRVYYIAWCVQMLARAIILPIIEAAFSLALFSKTGFIMLFLTFLPTCLLVTGFCLALTSFYDKSSTGSGAMLFFFLFGSMPGIFLASMPTWVYCVLCFLWPPMAAIEVPTLLIYADSVYYDGIDFFNMWSSTSTKAGVNLGVLLLCCWIGSVFWYALGYYLNKIVKHQYGTREKPCFCLEKKSDLSVCTIADTEEEVLDGGMFEKVDEETRAKPGVVIQHIDKSFPAVSKTAPPIVAVRDFSCSIYEGQITVLLGHNGAGKSTLINVLTGLYEATGGEALFYGHSIRNHMDEVRKLLGVCPQQNLLIPVLTCREHLELFARLRKIEEAKINDIVIEALKDIDMMDKENTQVQNLSGGMKRRLNVSMAFIGDPKVVFLDEPTSGMDPTSRRQVWSVLEKKKEGRVIVLCTHFMDEAEYLGDRVLVMNKGNLQVAGSSLFLKAKFGLGYHLAINKDTTSRDEAILSVVSEIIPSASIEESTVANLILALPRDSTKMFSDVLDSLASHKVEHAIGSVGLTATTLEEVFINLAHEADMSPVPEADEKKEGSGMTDGMPKEKEMVDMTTCTADTAFPVSDTKASLSEHIRVMLWKKKLMSFRQKSDLLKQVLMPIYFIVLSILIYKFGDFFFHTVPTSSVQLTPDLLLVNGNRSTLYTGYNNTDGESFLSRIMSHYMPTVSGVPVPSSLMEVVSDMSNTTLVASTVLTRGNSVAILDVSSTHLRIWFNTSFAGILPVMTSMLDSALLNSVSETNGLSLMTTYTALPTDGIAGMTVWQAIVIVLYVMYAAGGFMVMPIYASVSVAKERITQARLQQRLMGVWDVLYWLSNLLWDFCLSVIPNVFFAVATYLMVPALRPAVLAMFVEIFLFTLAILPFNYLIQFNFGSASAAEQAMMLVFSLSLYGSALVSALMTNVEWMKENADIVQYVLYCIPGYALYDSFMRLGTDFPMSTLLSKENQLNPWSWKYTGMANTYLIAEAIILIVIVILMERRSWISTGRVRYNPVPYTPTDNDVKEEIARVDAGPVEGCEEDAVEVKHVWKVYPGKGKVPPVEANRDVTFGLRKGDCFGLIGPNGAGKTSILSALMGTLGMNEGTCKVNGYNIPKDIMTIYDMMGYCPQFDVLFDFMTCYECLYFYGCIRGIPINIINTVITTCLSCLGLSEHRDKLTGTLSGGNKRRLCVAIAFMGNPSVVVLDEASTGLDPLSRKKLWNIVKSSASDRSFLITTHLMSEIEQLCNRVAILVNGQLQSIGSPEHLKERFGDGYTLDIKLEENMEYLEMLKQALIQEFKEYRIHDSHGCHAIIILPCTKTLSEIFRFIERKKEELHVVDYTLSQTTLDQIFIQFAKAQKEEEARKTLQELLQTS